MVGKEETYPRLLPCRFCFGESLNVFLMISVKINSDHQKEIEFVECLDCSARAPIFVWNYKQLKEF